ncbi:uncharacterized protein LOC142505172 isoform X2 [Primulina tabacum]|uniref:uncharacterized protein LOC142505172 isoform X2 n=1 Tax=Primulina tabacum TaxID=48773 RepID=UPI003F59301D
MEKSLHGSSRHDEVDFDLKEWGLKRRISRENTKSRRFSASNLTSFREDATSFRSNITISSTTSSPGYTPREEIDPSTYSFTTALKALQAKTIYTWEYLSPGEGYTLNSKWSEAEKYISNPLSGRVPLECLSAKTLSGRSFRSLTSRITMSAPLIYPSMNLQQPHCSNSIEKEQEKKISVQERLKTITTRDIGTQSTLVGLRSRSPSPIPTPSIEERSIKKSENEGGDSSVSSGKFTPDKECCCITWGAPVILNHRMVPRACAKCVLCGHTSGFHHVEVQKTREDVEFAQKKEGEEDRPSKARKKARTCSCFSLITRKRRMFEKTRRRS